MKKILEWWKKKKLKEKIFSIFLFVLIFLFLLWKNLIPMKITTYTNTGNWSAWYWLGKEFNRKDVR